VLVVHLHPEQTGRRRILLIRLDANDKDLSLCQPGFRSESRKDK
jgi:hypothetical protein